MIAPVEIAPGESGAAAPGFQHDVPEAMGTIRMPDIECPEDEMMEHLREAMQIEQSPEIVHRMDGHTVGSGNTVSTTGTLSMVGTSNPITRTL